MLQIGSVLDGTYEILEVLGKGGGGIVYKARHLRLKKLVAVKKIADNAMGKLNLRGEADILKNLHHTYLPQVYDFLELEGEVFTVIDYIPGRSLDYYLNQRTRLTSHQIVTWSRQLCEAVLYLHSRKPPIIHRDIKPANIMITPEGNICLIDFNISFGGAVQNYVRAISSGYSPPEQVISFSGGYQVPGTEIINEQSDIYSLGATMYHMATGIRADKDWRRIIPIGAYKGHVPDGLIKIIGRAMALNPADRYRNVAAMLEDLVHLRENDERRKQIRTMRCISVSVGMILMTGFLSLAVLGWQRMGRERTEKYEACTSQLYLYTEAEEYRRVIEYGMDVLNEGSLENGWKDGKEVRAQVEYMVANGYLETEEYEKAVLYYKEALKDAPNQKDSGIYRDYAVALGRLGKTKEAGRILEEESDMEEPDVLYVRAELSMAGGDNREAAGFAGKAAELLAKKIEAQESKEALSETKQLLKRTKFLEAEAYGNLAKAEPDAASSYYDKAVGCYEYLMKNGIVTDSLYLNLADIYRSMGQYSAAEMVLRELTGNGTKNYRAYGLMAVVLCEEQNLLPMEKRNYEEVKSYYDQAVSCFENSGEEAGSLMETLEDIMGQLKKGGWLKETP